MEHDAFQPWDEKKKRFINPHITHDKRRLRDAILWIMGRFDDKSELPPMPPSFQYPLELSPCDITKPRALWINHSTFFIQIDSIHILTDPIWGMRCSPFSYIGPKRHHPPALALEELQRVDHVLISHNHYDHLDKNTVLRLHELYPTISWWVPLGLKRWFHKLGITKVHELGWWHSMSSCESIQYPLHFTAVPSQHFSGRSLKDIGKSLWVGWVIEFPQGKRLYFAGDTGYNPIDFKNIGKRWPYMDLSLIPIGAYVPRKFMSPVHIDPWQAVQIHKEVRSRYSIGMHWHTFRLSDEETNRPPYDLFLALQEANIDPKTFIAVPPGHAINW